MKNLKIKTKIYLALLLTLLGRIIYSLIYGTDSVQYLLTVEAWTKGKLLLKELSK